MVVLALLAATMFAGCTPPKAPTLRLPPLPPECYAPTSHAALKPGDEARSALKRERGQLWRANRTQTACAEYYDTLRRILTE
mgnify:CR=1 FL=1